MTILSNFLCISLIFLVSLAYGGEEVPECTPKILGPKVTKCIQTLKHLTEITTTGKPDYKKVGPDVIKDCKSFQKCSPALKCLNDTSLEDVTVNLITNCEAAEYFITVFPKCNDKLEALNSTCLQEWNPFPEIDANATLIEKTKLEAEACKHFFGKEECVKNTIIKTCGEKEWDSFNKHQKNVAKIIGVCGGM